MPRQKPEEILREAQRIPRGAQGDMREYQMGPREYQGEPREKQVRHREYQGQPREAQGNGPRETQGNTKGGVGLVTRDRPNRASAGSFGKRFGRSFCRSSFGGKRTEAEASNFHKHGQKLWQNIETLVVLLPKLQFFHQKLPYFVEASVFYRSFGINRSFCRSFGFGDLGCLKLLLRPKQAKGRFGRSLM